MKKPLLIIGILALIGIAFYGGMAVMHEQKRTEEVQKSPEEIKRELKYKESRDPTSYLEVESSLKNNIKKGGLFKKQKVDGQIVSGTIKNKATMATFKDVVVELRFYSQTDTEIGKQRFVVYENYPPNSEKSFRYKMEMPSATDSFSANVVDAKPVY